MCVGKRAGPLSPSVFPLILTSALVSGHPKGILTPPEKQGSVGFRGLRI